MGQDFRDDFAASVAGQGDDDRLRAILTAVCERTGMGFAAIARVTEERWIACHVLDKIEFGLNPGHELEIKTTICNEIRQCGRAVIIDEVSADEDWRSHPAPMLYGFESYASLPVILPDGSFYGTLCAIDPAPRKLSGAEIVAALQAAADEAARILSEKIAAPV